MHFVRFSFLKFKLFIWELVFSLHPTFDLISDEHFNDNTFEQVINASHCEMHPFWLFSVCVRSVSATLLIQLRYGNELLSCSVSFKVIVYISTTFRISKHYTVQTFNLDSHKPYKNNSETIGQPKECDVPHIHTHSLSYSQFSRCCCW